MGHTLAVLITLCLSPPRAPDSGSAWSSLLAGGVTILRSQVSTLLVQNLAHLNGSIITSVCQEGVEAWKVMLLGWRKGRWATDSGRQSRTLAGVGTGCSYLAASLSANVGLWCPPSLGRHMHLQRDWCRATPISADAEPRVQGGDIFTIGKGVSQDA